MAVRESVIEKKFVKRISEEGGKAIKLNCVGFRFMPDRMCLFPNAFLAFVELKADNGRLAKGQVLRIKWLRSWGFPVYVLKGMDEVEAVINAINIERHRARSGE